MLKTYKNKEAAIPVMNDLGSKGIPFLFLIDYEMKKIIVNTNLDDSIDIRFSINSITNSHNEKSQRLDYYFDKYPMSFVDYQKGFDFVSTEIQKGNSFLLNLTYPTKVLTNLSLDEIFDLTTARYKVRLKNQFVCYSPEIFVQIVDGRIISHPMKGTIDADIENAEQKVLSDSKELAEHYTIVDLIRNDLSRVANRVKVDKFRYIEKIETPKKNLLQVSSEISGQLPDNYREHIGDIMFTLLPAGSISGAPKTKTIEVIRGAEKQDRGYYTGICGYFDGKNLDSGVMIRFVEKSNDSMMYRSGCGVTSLSNVDSEYSEMIDKVYLPIEKSTQAKHQKPSSSNV